MARYIGTIEGKVDTTSFNVMLSTKDIEKGSFVKVNHENYGWVLAKISDLKRYMKKGDEVLMAKAKTIGYKEDGQVRIPKTPFKPNGKVYDADKKLIQNVMGLSKRRSNHIYLGLMEGHDIPVYLDINGMIGKHMSVLAKTGAGKSYTVAVTLEELLKNNVPVVVIDPHGEYSTLTEENSDYDGMMKFGVKPKSYENRIKEYTANILTNPDAEKLTLNPKVGLHELIDIIPMKLSETQKSILYDALKELEGKDYNLQDIINVVRLEESKSAWKVLAGLETLRNSGIFDGTPVSEEDLIQKGHATIINLKGAEHHIQELVVAKLAGDLFNAIKIGKIPPFFFLVEEAHNFCPERGFGNVLSSRLLRDIASEGRKFGFHLCVVSQRPARVDKNVLSQCNTQVILKVTNPNDLRAIRQSIEGFSSGMEEDIKMLSVGQGLVVGECVQQPITVNIRTRETKHKKGVAAAKKKKKKKKKTNQSEKIAEKIKPVFLKNKGKDSMEELLEKIKRKQEKEKEGKKIRDRLKRLFIKEPGE